MTEPTHNDGHRWCSGWRELDSHSDLRMSHELKGVPTLVRLEFARAAGKKLLRQKEFGQLIQNLPKVSRYSAIIERCPAIDEFVAQGEFNRWRMWVHWNPMKPVIGTQFDERPPEIDFKRNYDSPFLEGLDEVDG